MTVHLSADAVLLILGCSGHHRLPTYALITEEERHMTVHPVADEQAKTLSVKAGGVCLLIGTVTFAMARLLHGDTRPPTPTPR